MMMMMQEENSATVMRIYQLTQNPEYANSGSVDPLQTRNKRTKIGGLEKLNWNTVSIFVFELKIPLQSATKVRCK
jgi:hypothetical protein